MTAGRIAIENFLCLVLDLGSKCSQVHSVGLL
jgi:hypothetical protein